MELSEAPTCVIDAVFIAQMELSNLTKKKLRYFWNCSHSLLSPYSQFPVSKTPSSGRFSFNPIFVSQLTDTNNNSHPLVFPTPSTGSSTIFSETNPSPSPLSVEFLNVYRHSGRKGLSFIHSDGASSSVCSNPGLLRIRSDCCFRWYSTSYTRSSKSEEVGVGQTIPYATSKQVGQIIELIRCGDSELESKLSSMNVYLPLATVTQIFHFLNLEKVSALRFFHWIRHWQPEFYGNSDVCSLMIHNCGRLGDDMTMRSLLNDFSLKDFRLNKSAFGFLPVLISSNESLKKCVDRVVDVLNNVRGSSRASGIPALIEMLSAMDSFEMALFVIRKAGRRVSYYNILVREKCRKCDFNGAREILNEMRQDNCPPPVQTYNYLLSSLCKNDNFGVVTELLEEMDARFCPPDAITFEIFICHSWDIASVISDQMVKRGVKPRLTTHAVFIKGYFKAERYEEAYNYVVGSSEKYKCDSNMNYSLLASLHLKRGNLAVALNILCEMMDKDLRPYYRVYKKVLKNLQKSGRGDLAKDLNSRFSSLSLELTKDVGCLSS